MDSSYLKYFECPECDDFFEPPIYQCFSGHSICKRCKDICKRKCPTCSSPIRNTRNYLLEKMVIEAEIFCEIEECDVKSTLSNYIQHEESCEFNHIVECKVRQCNWEDCINLLNEHIENEHKSLVIENKSELQSHQYTLAIVKYEDYMFWVWRNIDDDNNELKWYAQSTTNIFSDERFVLTIKAYSPDGEYYAISQSCSTDIFDAEESLFAKSILHMDRNEAKGCKFILQIETH